MTEEKKSEIDISKDIATVELTIEEWNGLLTALNVPFNTPATVSARYINMLATQLEAQVPKLVEIKRAMLLAEKNANESKTAT